MNDYQTLQVPPINAMQSYAPAVRTNTPLEGSIPNFISSMCFDNPGITSNINTFTFDHPKQINQTTFDKSLKQFEMIESPGYPVSYMFRRL
jgi:hypothetical protein